MSQPQFPSRGGPSTAASGVAVPLRRIARSWTRIGVTGFGGPPAHIALLRRLCVEQRGWIPAGSICRFHQRGGGRRISFRRAGDA